MLSRWLQEYLILLLPLSAYLFCNGNAAHPEKQVLQGSPGQNSTLGKLSHSVYQSFISVGSLQHS
ncbi:hypothetical protein GBAR_LOCUS22114 [Geodia barretti]|uniref:Uncharacterized protein n=1 Tax=Geodia barretti TaxID=519541 RepID=A0AA35T3J7_GEOBA|nr:hypothetical protein GBAR_LOCUS22114 [Geodia barretti]